MESQFVSRKQLMTELNMSYSQLRIVLSRNEIKPAKTPWFSRKKMYYRDDVLGKIAPNKLNRCLLEKEIEELIS